MVATILLKTSIIFCFIIIVDTTYGPFKYKLFRPKHIKLRKINDIKAKDNSYDEEIPSLIKRLESIRENFPINVPKNHHLNQDDILFQNKQKFHKKNRRNWFIRRLGRSKRLRSHSIKKLAGSRPRDPDPLIMASPTRKAKYRHGNNSISSFVPQAANRHNTGAAKKIYRRKGHKHLNGKGNDAFDNKAIQPYIKRSADEQIFKIENEQTLDKPLITYRKSWLPYLRRIQERKRYRATTILPGIITGFDTDGLLRSKRFRDNVANIIDYPNNTEPRMIFENSWQPYLQKHANRYHHGTTPLSVNNIFAPDNVIRSRGFRGKSNQGKFSMLAKLQLYVILLGKNSPPPDRDEVEFFTLSLCPGDNKEFLLTGDADLDCIQDLMLSQVPKNQVVKYTNDTKKPVELMTFFVVDLNEMRRNHQHNRYNIWRPQIITKYLYTQNKKLRKEVRNNDIAILALSAVPLVGGVMKTTSEQQKQFVNDVFVNLRRSGYPIKSMLKHSAELTPCSLPYLEDNFSDSEVFSDFSLKLDDLKVEKESGDNSTYPIGSFLQSVKDYLTSNMDIITGEDRLQKKSCKMPAPADTLPCSGCGNDTVENEGNVRISGKCYSETDPCPDNTVYFEKIRQMENLPKNYPSKIYDCSQMKFPIVAVVLQGTEKSAGLPIEFYINKATQPVFTTRRATTVKNITICTVKT